MGHVSDSPPTSTQLEGLGDAFERTEPRQAQRLLALARGSARAPRTDHAFCHENRVGARASKVKGFIGCRADVARHAAAFDRLTPREVIASRDLNPRLRAGALGESSARSNSGSNPG
jgi:hypothetical protein